MKSTKQPKYIALTHYEQFLFSFETIGDPIAVANVLRKNVILRNTNFLYIKRVCKTGWCVERGGHYLGKSTAYEAEQPYDWTIFSSDAIVWEKIEDIPQEYYNSCISNIDIFKFFFIDGIILKNTLPFPENIKIACPVEILEDVGKLKLWQNTFGDYGT